jgi:heterotetrameric sarcosine oxidase gamma subunit
VASPGIIFGVEAPDQIFLLARPIAGAALDAVKEALGATELPEVGRTAGRRSTALLGIGPSRWLLVREAGADDSAAIAPSTLARAFRIVTDMSDAWIRIRISGRAVRDLFAKGSTLDLDPRFFPPGACAAAPFAHMPAVLHRPEDGSSFHLYAGRSHALSFHEWLVEAAAEFGCEATHEEERAGVDRRNVIAS